MIEILNTQCEYGKVTRKVMEFFRNDYEKSISEKIVYSLSHSCAITKPSYK